MSEEQNAEQRAAANTPPSQVNEQPNLEAIMHVPLEISVELGRVKMPLHVVSRLGRGGVVELNKEASGEVDILANGQAFARGEVVAADGKLAVRIVEVIAPGDRVRTLA
ncbi:MAG: FliM/FliN family flagellar motor switch protein [Mariprofundaceae bacterium]